MLLSDKPYIQRRSVKFRRFWATVVAVMNHNHLVFVARIIQAGQSFEAKIP
jgi:hypothetical protein